MRERHGKQALVSHPWITYRRVHGIDLDLDRTGTVVFFTHSNATTTPVFSSLDAYMRSLCDLPAPFHPVVICLSFHDVLKGMHQTLRRYGYPIVTAGTTSNQCFIDRFYGIARRFRHACSPTIGSHSFYLAEAGVAFFLHGQAPTYVIKGSRSVADGEQDLRDYGDDEDMNSASWTLGGSSPSQDAVTTTQLNVVGQYLGQTADAGPNISRRVVAGVQPQLAAGRRPLPRICPASHAPASCPPPENDKQMMNKTLSKARMLIEQPRVTRFLVPDLAGSPFKLTEAIVRGRIGCADFRAIWIVAPDRAVSAGDEDGQYASPRLVPTSLYSVSCRMTVPRWARRFERSWRAISATSVLARPTK